MDVLRSVSSEDSLAFFRLYENAPMYSSRFLNYLITDMREIAYSHLIRAYLRLPILDVQVLK